MSVVTLAAHPHLLAVSNPLPGLATKVASSAFDAIAESLAKAAGEMFTATVTMWTGQASSPVNVACDGAALEAASCGASWIQVSTSWLVGIVAVASILFAAMKMILTRSGQPAHDVGRSLIIMILVTGAGLAVIDYLVIAGDEIAKNLIASVGGTANLGENIFLATGVAGGFTFLLGLFGAIVGMAQYILLLSRDALLIVFAGILPLAAAGSATETGNQWFKRVTAWTFAMIIYKPVAALIYAAALMQMSSGSSLKTALSGLALMILAIAALPALMRLVMPAVGAATGTGGGAMAIGTAVASGAIMVATAGTAAPLAAGAATVGAVGATGQAGNTSVPDPPADNPGTPS